MAMVWVWPLGTVAYLILTGSTDLDETLVAVLLGGLGAAWHAAVLKVEARRFAFERPTLRVVGLALVGLPGATAAVGNRLVSALLRGAAGRQADVPFDLGPQGVPAETGRRAVVVLATSLAPDSYVLRIPANEGELQVHALAARTPGGDRRWPA